jgi:hypothetical protein
MSVFEFVDVFGAGVDWVSELLLESTPLWPHAAKNKLRKLVAMTSLFK